jgi:xanthine dehydrogenase small subunit
MFDLPLARLDTRPIVKALRGLQDTGLAYEGPNADGSERRGRYWAPKTLDDFAALREQHPQARLLAGSTDIGLWVNKMFRDVGDLLYIGDVAELRCITRQGSLLRIGAAAPLEDAWAALVAEVPALADMWLRFASLPVRNAGTMGGNVANGSPIGDSAPVLMSLGARVVLRRGTSQRSLPLEGFYLDYMKNALEAGEFVEALEVPLPAAGTTVRAYKLSKRFDCDISAVACGLAVTRDANDVVTAARFAFGGMAAVVKRATDAEAAVLGRAWNEASVQAAMTALATDYQPLSDMRASAGYRLRSAQNLLQRFWLETRREAPLSIDQTTVWSVMQHVTHPRGAFGSAR